MFTLATCCLTMSLDLTFPASYAILFFTASDFPFSMRHIHNGASFPLWRSCFILYGAICNCPFLFPVAYWTSSDQRGSSSGVIFFFYLFVLYMGLSRQKYWSRLLFPPPMDYILSEFFTLPVLVALHGMVHSFIELHKPIHHGKGGSFLTSYAAAAAKSLQSCLTLCDPIDGSPPGSPVPGILQARILEWVAISFSNRYQMTPPLWQKVKKN